MFRAVIERLDGCGIRHMVAGSFASVLHGDTRSTSDIDLVIDPTPASFDCLLDSFGPEDFYVPRAWALRALALREAFKVIDLRSTWSIDLYVRKERPFSLSELERRLPARIFDVDLFVATPEDVVLAKLEWALGGPDRDRTGDAHQDDGTPPPRIQSERQLEDAVGVLRRSAGLLDHAYLDRWAAELDVAPVLQIARRMADPQALG